MFDVGINFVYNKTEENNYGGAFNVRFTPEIHGRSMVI